MGMRHDRLYEGNLDLYGNCAQSDYHLQYAVVSTLPAIKHIK